MLTVPNHLILLYVPKNVFEEDSLHDLPNDLCCLACSSPHQPFDFFWRHFLQLLGVSPGVHEFLMMTENGFSGTHPVFSISSDATCWIPMTCKDQSLPSSFYLNPFTLLIVHLLFEPFDQVQRHFWRRLRQRCCWVAQLHLYLLSPSHPPHSPLDPRLPCSAFCH